MRVKRERSIGPANTVGPDRATHEDRARAFRKSHQVGAVVRGRVAGWESSGLAWVHIDGQPLLACLPPETPVGARLTFAVTALTPDIVLKIMTGRAAGSTRAEHTAEFVAARAAFESAAAGPPDQSLAARLSQDPELAGLLARTLACLHRLNQTLPDNARLAYPARLVPLARDLELLIRRTPATEEGEPEFLDLLLTGSLAAFGAFQVRLLAKGERSSVRVLAENRDALAAKAGELTRAVAQAAGMEEPAWLGLEPLPRSRRGGALSELTRP